MPATGRATRSRPRVNSRLEQQLRPRFRKDCLRLAIRFKPAHDTVRPFRMMAVGARGVARAKGTSRPARLRSPVDRITLPTDRMVEPTNRTKPTLFVSAITERPNLFAHCSTLELKTSRHSIHVDRPAVRHRLLRSTAVQTAWTARTCGCTSVHVHGSHEPAPLHRYSHGYFKRTAHASRETSGANAPRSEHPRPPILCTASILHRIA